MVLYDDDHFYMGSVLAELLVARGCEVDFVTPAAKVAEWTENTLEQAIIQRRLLEMGVTAASLQGARVDRADERDSGLHLDRAAKRDLACDAVVMVTAACPTMRCTRRWYRAGGMAGRRDVRSS